MADENTEVEQNEQQETAGQDASAQLTEALEAIEALKRKNQELLGEKKSASQKARELEEERQAAERERMEHEGQHKELAERYQTESQRYQKELEDLKRSIASEKLGNKAMALANEYASDPRNAKLLSRFIRDELDYVDGNVVPKNHASIEDMVKAMEQSGDYASVWKGKQSNGGSAPGGKGGGAAGKKLSDMGDNERRELQANDPAAFAQLVAEARQKRN